MRKEIKKNDWKKRKIWVEEGKMLSLDFHLHGKAFNEIGWVMDDADGHDASE